MRKDAFVIPENKNLAEKGYRWETGAAVKISDLEYADDRYDKDRLEGIKGDKLWAPDGSVARILLDERSVNPPVFSYTAWENIRKAEENSFEICPDKNFISLITLPHDITLARNGFYWNNAALCSPEGKVIHTFGGYDRETNEVKIDGEWWPDEIEGSIYRYLEDKTKSFAKETKKNISSGRDER